MLESDELTAALAQAQSTVRAAESRIRQWRSVGAPNAREQLAQAEANARLAQSEHARQSALFAQGFIGQARLDESRRSLSVAQSQLAAARSTAEANRDDGAERQILEDQLATARAARDAAAAKLAQTRIVAPAAGVVLERSAEPGDIAQPGRTAMTLALDGATQVVVQIDEKNLSQLRLGQSALGSADAYPRERFPAELVYINPGIDPLRGSVEVKLRIPKPPAYLRQDMTASVDIEVARHDNVLVIPSGAVFDAAGSKPWVLAIAGRHAVKRPVKLGLKGDGSVEVVDGLGGGERVVAAAGAGVTPGERVRVAGDES